jgi:hypothetical protein
MLPGGAPHGGQMLDTTCPYSFTSGHPAFIVSLVHLTPLIPQVLDKIPHHEHTQVHCRSLAFQEPVVAVGIGHVVESLSEFDEAIYQPFGHLDVRVCLACPVNDQEVSLQALGKVDWGRPTVSSRAMDQRRQVCIKLDSTFLPRFS